MATPPSPPARKTNRRRSTRQNNTTPEPPPQSALRAIRAKCGLTQLELGRRAGMHRNSIRKLEDGTTHEVTFANANALAVALNVAIPDLGLRVRPAAGPRSIRLRRLSAEQRQVLDDLLSLPPEDYVLIREAIEQRRKMRTKPRPGRGRR